MAGMDIDKTLVSDLARDQMVAEFGGIVESQFAKDSIMRQYTTIRPLTGTDTLMNRRVGRPTLQAINDSNVGTTPAPAKTPFGKVSVTVDTIVLARDVRSELNEFQTDFSAREALGIEQGKELGKFFDQSFIIQCIKGALKTETQTLGGAFNNGKNLTLNAVGDEADPTKLVKGIRQIITNFAEEDIDRSELVVFVRPTEFQTLLDADKLINTQYSATNGDYAQSRLAMIEGARIVETARIPRAAITDHKLGTAYNVSATEATAMAVIMHPRSLLAAETIPLQSNVHHSNVNYMWYIDSYLAYGVNVNRADLCGAIFKKTA